MYKCHNNRSSVCITRVLHITWIIKTFWFHKFEIMHSVAKKIFKSYKHINI